MCCVAVWLFHPPLSLSVVASLLYILFPSYILFLLLLLSSDILILVLVVASFFFPDIGWVRISSCFHIFLHFDIFPSLSRIFIRSVTHPRSSQSYHLSIFSLLYIFFIPSSIFLSIRYLFPYAYQSVLRSTDSVSFITITYC